ncbi:zinc-ribbon domain-containing protein [Lactobacillus sp. AN1001]
MKFCDNCGKKVGLNAMFCPSCGKSLKNSEKTLRKVDMDQLKKKGKQVINDITGFIKNIDIKKDRKKIIGIGTGLVVVIVAIFMFFSHNSLNRIIPDHAYYVPQLNRYLVFGTGKNASKFAMVPDKGNALYALESEAKFDGVYSEFSADEDKKETGYLPIDYKVSGDELLLKLRLYYTPNTNYFEGTETEFSGGFFSTFAASALLPLVQEGINSYINSNNIQAVDQNLKLSDFEITGGNEKKINAKAENAQGKVFKLTLIEVKDDGSDKTKK